MRKLVAALLGLALLVAPAAAEACRIHIPISDRIASWYDEGLIDTVLIVEVVETGPQEGPNGLTYGLAKTAEVIAVSEGQFVAEQFEFDRDLLVVSCGWSNNLRTRPGELLAVYLILNQEGEREVFMTLTLSDAITSDANVAQSAAREGLKGNSTLQDDFIRGHPRRKPRFDPVPTPDLSNPTP